VLGEGAWEEGKLINEEGWQGRIEGDEYASLGNRDGELWRYKRMDKDSKLIGSLRGEILKTVVISLLNKMVSIKRESLRVYKREQGPQRVSYPKYR